jgi:hypothetical protein
MTYAGFQGEILLLLFFANNIPVFPGPYLIAHENVFFKPAY